LIGAWLESKSPFVDFSSLGILGLEGLRSATWGALVLVIICGPTLRSNVISPMGENPLRCTTQDKKGLVLTKVLFYLIF